jgi:hypothetical protein
MPLGEIDGFVRLELAFGFSATDRDAMLAVAALIAKLCSERHGRRKIVAERC